MTTDNEDNVAKNAKKHSELVLRIPAAETAIHFGQEAENNNGLVTALAAVAAAALQATHTHST